MLCYPWGLLFALTIKEVGLDFNQQLYHPTADGFIDKSHLFQATSEQTIARVIKKRIQQRYETFLKEYYDFENKNSNQHPDVDYNSCRYFYKSVGPKISGIKNGRKSNGEDTKLIQAMLADEYVELASPNLPNSAG